MKLLLFLIPFLCFADLKTDSLNKAKEAFWKYDIFPMPYVGYNIDFYEQPKYFNGENKSFYLNLKKKQIIEACRFHIKRFDEMCSTNWYVSSYPKYCEEGAYIWKRNYWKGGGNWIISPGFPLLNTCKAFLKSWGLKENRPISKKRAKLLKNLQEEADKISEKVSTFGKDIFYLNRDAKDYCEKTMSSRISSCFNELQDYHLKIKDIANICDKEKKRRGFWPCIYGTTEFSTNKYLGIEGCERKHKERKEQFVLKCKNQLKNKMTKEIQEIKSRCKNLTSPPDY